MGSYPVDIRRCQHIKTSGAQCGSPALRNEKLCYYHQHNRLAAAELYLDGDRYCDSQIMIPPFEDAHSIQMVLRHVVQLMLQKRIDRKDAGLMLYALQIASGNLKQLQAEKPRPTQVVMDPEKVEETPIGMTPWSATGQGHDPDEGEGEERPADSESTTTAPPTPEELCRLVPTDDRHALITKWRDKGVITHEEIDNYVMSGGPDPILLAICRDQAERKRRAAKPAEQEDKESGNAETPVGSDSIPPTTGATSAAIS
jgi:hypothetical protein